MSADINPDACTDASIEVCICMCIDAAQGSLGLKIVYGACGCTDEAKRIDVCIDTRIELRVCV